MTVSRRDFEDAVAAYWGAKQTQNELSAIKNKVGAGTAGSVRSGKHFDTIAALLAKFFLEAGVPSRRDPSHQESGAGTSWLLPPIELMESLDWRHFSAAISARLAYLHELGMP
ncbi:MAG TPA: hypothetical protein VFQ48_11650 [Pseudonocardiaceae bacterium]|nr:hypothetical protein [Pseudonocardiaceae bacterium]